MYCWDAALRTSAAPTYFPAHRGSVRALDLDSPREHGQNWPQFACLSLLTGLLRHCRIFHRLGNQQPESNHNFLCWNWARDNVVRCSQLLTLVCVTATWTAPCSLTTLACWP